MTMRTDLAIAAPLSAARPRPSARMVPAEGRAEAGAPAATAASRPRAEERSRWLYGPVVDFLLLGGGSFLVLGAMAAFFPRDEASRVALAGAMLFLAHFVNHPHFAHSYQIFYRGFVRKAFGPCCHDDLARAEDKAPLSSGEGFGVRAEREFTGGLASGLASEVTGARVGEAWRGTATKLADLLNPETRRHLFTASGRPAPIAARDGQTQTGGWHRRPIP